MNKKLGIIAGQGDFPREVCRRAKKQDYEVYVCAVEGEADALLETLADEVAWVKLGQVGKVLAFFAKHEVHEAVLCGKIHKTGILSGKIIPDWDAMQIVTHVRNFKDDSLLIAFSNYLERRNVKILDSTRFLAEESDLKMITKRRPSKSQIEDIQFGFDIAKQIAGLDIGQTVVVKNKSVVAVESVEGTDQAILRGGRLAGEGAVVIKVAKPNQDMRFDVPTVGPDTIAACLEAKIAVLAFEAGKTIILHPEQVQEAANQAGLILVPHSI
ncbi:MAG: LpxI family protein [Candidatus Omnitrophica bacterium]|nr:LpxI family protein [Candidatus Omnitrophota bacterium]